MPRALTREKLMKPISDSGANLRKAIYRRLLELWRPDHASLSQTCAGSIFSRGAAQLLMIASKLYERGLRADQVKRRRESVRLPIPVISIGNLSTGGTGKTPLTVWISEFLVAAGFHPAVLSRGYGRQGGSPGVVPSAGDPGELSKCFGDEPVMMSAYLPAVPVWVGRDRASSGKAALAQGEVDVLLLDDGFQHLALERDLDIVLLDCRSPFGNGRLLPAGPLREPLSNLGRADGFVITHAENDVDSKLLARKLESLFPGKAVFSCRHKVSGIRLKKGGAVINLNAFPGRRAIAFAGIAGPEGFFEDLRNGGIEICGTLGFPDHHRYGAADFSMIFRTASEQGAEVIITTAKDSVRIPHHYRDAFAVAEIEIDFGEDRERFRGMLASAVNL
jgi:tetraacyldisaccharide 4'-kinase